MTSNERVCTCHPTGRPPICQHRYAATECQDAYRAYKATRVTVSCLCGMQGCNAESCNPTTFKLAIASIEIRDLRAALATRSADETTTRRPPHWTCKTHGDFDAMRAVGCPECMRLTRQALIQIQRETYGSRWEASQAAHKIACAALDPMPPEEPSRELSPSEAASFGKTLARSPRRVEPTDLRVTCGCGHPMVEHDYTTGCSKCTCVRVRVPEKASAPMPGGSVYRVCCARCQAQINLTASDGRVNLHQKDAIGWYFSTDTGWLCPADAPK